MVTHKREVSDKVIIILLVLAILFSIGGSVIVYETVHNLKAGMNGPNYKVVSAATGLVSLEVVDNPNNLGGGQ